MSKYDIEGVAKDLNIDLRDVVILYESYIEDMRNLTYKMEDAIINDDWYSLKKICNSIASASDNMKIEDVYKASINFNRAIIDKNFDKIDIYSKRITQLLADAEDQLKELFLEKGIQL